MVILPSIGIPGLIIILVLALILFGPAKLPQLGKAVGETLREFKSSTRELVEDDHTKQKDEKKEN